jgi:hypothetical protein
MAWSFGICTTIVEPGGARPEFRYGSAQVAKLTSSTIKLLRMAF